MSTTAACMRCRKPISSSVGWCTECHAIILQQMHANDPPPRLSTKPATTVNSDTNGPNRPQQAKRPVSRPAAVPEKTYFDVLKFLPRRRYGRYPREDNPWQENAIRCLEDG